MTDKRYFKIMKPDKIECPIKLIPWDFIESHERQAIRNHSQTLETLNRRGGLSPKELFAVKHDMTWRDLSLKVDEQFAVNWLIKEIENQKVEE